MLYTVKVVEFPAYWPALRRIDSWHRLIWLSQAACRLSGSQTPPIWEHVGLDALQCESSAAVSAKGYCGILAKLGRMDIADTRVLCSAARRWGRHTVNCRQNRKAESCEICILTARVHKSVKIHCYTRWYTEKQDGIGGGLWGWLKRGWKQLGSRIPLRKHGCIRCRTPNCPTLTRFTSHQGLQQKPSLAH